MRGCCGLLSQLWESTVSSTACAVTGMIDYDEELRSNTWKGQRDGNPDIEEQLAHADAEADEVSQGTMAIPSLDGQQHWLTCRA